MESNEGKDMEAAIVSTPAAKVFDITELAEMVFLKLPLQDLLVNVQRACRLWRAIVLSSARLQKALFFLPKGPMVYPEEHDRYAVDLSGNRIAAKNIAQNAWLYPLIYKATRAVKHGAPACLFAAEASWRRMYISQPPHARCEYWLNADDLPYAPFRQIYRMTRCWTPWFSCADPIGIKLGVGSDQMLVQATYMAQIVDTHRRGVVPKGAFRWRNVEMAEDV